MRIVGIRYNTKEGPKTMTYFNDSLKKVRRPAGEISDQFGQVLKGGQLMKRLNSDVCELCGAEHCALEIHHVRKLKDIVKKYRKRGTPMPNWVCLLYTSYGDQLSGGFAGECAAGAPDSGAGRRYAGLSADQPVFHR